MLEAIVSIRGDLYTVLGTLLLTHVVVALLFRRSVLARLVYLLGYLLAFVLLLNALNRTHDIHWLYISLKILSAVVCLCATYLYVIWLRHPLRELEKLVVRLHGGDLRPLRDTERYGGYRHELKNMAQLLDELRMRLHEVLSSARRDGDQVLELSEQLTDQGHTLAQGTSEQASSAEEMAGTIESISALSDANSGRSMHAEQVSRTMMERVEEQSNRMREVNERMSNIDYRVSVLTEIVNQTNILALNAAVEAARAGEAGRGFAVVAAEVRKLAENSREAAQEIIEEVDVGAALAHGTAEFMHSNIDHFVQVQKLVEEINTNSAEQRDRLVSIATAVEEASRITQVAADLAQRQSESARVLTEIARRLKGQIDFFQLTQ